ncbi:MAG TPA: sugar nucleotide-binding protein, partial [Pseudobdellovibrionaceae bacterium]|nr:sugar nucleotide-binding protein [Pseudobdellovibrionaceae bacterium]
MKVLVLGASGMVGSAFFQEMTRRKWDVWAGLRKSSGDYEAYFQKAQVVENLNATKWELIENALKQLKPDVVVNAAGVTLRKPEIKDLDFSLKVNSQLPQMLKFWCQRENSYLVHMSTDCVFSGTTEAEYDERSIPDALDIYGRTKALG